VLSHANVLLVSLSFNYGGLVRSKKRTERKQVAKKLTDRQKRFVNEYLIDLNATQAAIRSGYKKEWAHTNANKLLQNTDVKQYITDRQKAMQERAEITQDDVLKELAKIGFADIRKAVKWGPALDTLDTDQGPMLANGVVLVDSDQLDEATAASISEIAQTNQGVKIKMHDKRQALVDIGRHLGMFTDKLKVDIDSPATELERLKQLALKAQDKEK
jgi:phage terminase small subunit